MDTQEYDANGDLNAVWEGQINIVYLILKKCLVHLIFQNFATLYSI